MHPAIIQLRQQLHRHPELSGQESGTAQMIKDFLFEHLPPSELISELGGHGLAAVYTFGPGPVIVLRCELDALPIPERGTQPWSSTNPGVSHKCGHDGHMAMVAGTVFWLREQSLSRGKVVFLFQPAEETGRGARQLCADPRFAALAPDYVFALHNIPGAAMGEILMMKAGFSAEVISCAISLTGTQAHAAEPENGVNPAYALGALLKGLRELNVEDPVAEDFALLTPVHCRVGEVAYGIAPGNGELHYTLRTWTTKTMDVLREALRESVARVSKDHGLQCQIDWREHFPASINDAAANDLVRRAAARAGLRVVDRPYPFKFGEDFGWFSRQYKTAMFGLGAGGATPALHHVAYDFPDELLPAGVTVFSELLRQILEE